MFVFINVVFVVEEVIFFMSRPIIIATTFLQRKNQANARGGNKVGVCAIVICG